MEFPDDDGEEATSVTRHGLAPFPRTAAEYYKKESTLVYLSEKRHDHLAPLPPPSYLGDTSLDWRSRDRLKTVAVALAVCLNAGVDPPDVVKTAPCAKLECWLDPLAYPEPKKAVDAVTKQLGAQYEVWQPRARYKVAPDPTAEDLKRMCALSRRTAKEERVLFHYNGHGVPKPTPSGEIWVFNKEFTQYIPVSLHDLQGWLQAPSILVWDTSAAENIVNAWNKFADQRDKEGIPAVASGKHSGGSIGVPNAVSLRECVHLASCRGNETLPTDPSCPADMFTSCLTTPIETALRYFVQQSPILASTGISQVDPSVGLDVRLPVEEGLLPSAGSKRLDVSRVLELPGKLSDRRTPLGELNWIFTAVTDTIAWTTLPHPTFKRLFRQDMMMAALFRNFLLAQRVMRTYGCEPVSYPALPDTSKHEMWSAWDAAVDLCLAQLPDMLDAVDAGHEIAYTNSSFFAEQLKAFEVWLDRGVVAEGKPPPQLPVVLQVLLSQIHRLRALFLLSRFVDLGPWAVRQALAVGIFPYITKLLQAPAIELKPVLIFIWGRIAAVERECVCDLVKDDGYGYFLRFLAAPDAALGGIGVGVGVAHAGMLNISEHRAMCAFVLALFCRHGRNAGAREVCLRAGVLGACVARFGDSDSLLRQWSCLCVAEVWSDYTEGKWTGVRDKVHESLVSLAQLDPVPEVRTAAVYALSTLLGDDLDRTAHQIGAMEYALVVTASGLHNDASAMVRREVVALCSKIVSLDMERSVRAAVRVLEDDYIGADAMLGTSIIGGVAPVYPGVNLVSSAASVHVVGDDLLVELVNWRTLLLLAADPHPQVASQASAVVDVIHRHVWETTVLGEELNASLMPVLKLMQHQAHVEADEANHAANEAGLTYSPVLSSSGRPKSMYARIATITPPPSAGASSAIAQLDAALSPPMAYGMLQPPASPGFDRRPVSYGNAQGMSRFSSLRRGASGIRSTLSQLYYGNANANAQSSNAEFSAAMTRNGGVGAKRAMPRRRSFSSAATGDPILPLSAGRNRGVVRVNSEQALGKRATSEERRRSNAYRSPSIKEKSPLLHAHAPPEQLVGRTPLPLYSDFLEWSTEYFREPQTREQDRDEPGSLKYTQRLWQHNYNESLMREAQASHAEMLHSRWDHARPALLHEDAEPRLLQFHQFRDHLIVCDGRQRVSVWDWSTSAHKVYPELINSFQNMSAPHARATSVTLMNEDDQSLLAIGSDDGIVRVYSEYDDPDRQRLVSSWRALSRLQSSSYRSSGMLMEWQQTRGAMICTGDVNYLRVWDVAREACIVELPTDADCCVSCLTSDRITGDLLVAGFGDGALRVFDRRLPPKQAVVRIWEEHNDYVLGARLQRGGSRDLVSVTVRGEAKFWDIRWSQSMRALQLEVSDAETRAFDVHDFAQVFATASSASVLSIANFDGDTLGTVRYYPGIIGQRLAPPVSVAFHPHRGLVAYGGMDGYVMLVESSARRHRDFTAGVMPLRVPDLAEY